jgi:hypothetical protein
MTADHQRLTILLLALLALVMRDGSVPHQHLGPGWYNSDHDVSALATVGGGLVPDAPEASPSIVEVGSPPPARLTCPPSAPQRHPDSRAPPHA